MSQSADSYRTVGGTDQVGGSHPAEDIVRTAAERPGAVTVLLDVVRREDADLLVVRTTG